MRLAEAVGAEVVSRILWYAAVGPRSSRLLMVVILVFLLLFSFFLVDLDSLLALSGVLLGSTTNTTSISDHVVRIGLSTPLMTEVSD